MAYVKHTWIDKEIITKEKLNNIENGIATIELTPGPAGPTGPQGAKGDTGAQGPAGKDAVINKLTKIEALAGDADVATVVIAFNKLIADLKAKGLMNS